MEMETRRRSTRHMARPIPNYRIGKPTARVTRQPICGTAQGSTVKAKGGPKRVVNKKINFVDVQNAKSGPDPNANSILFRLPREIFLLVAGFLPVESLICLSLTCKGALQVIGRECWESPDIRKRSIRFYNEARWNLIQCLARDSGPRLTKCDFCTSLHPHMLPPKLHCKTGRTKKCLSEWGLIDYFPQVKSDVEGPGYSLVYPHIQCVFDDPSTLDHLVGNFTADNAKLTYRLASGAAWVNGNLILQHMHYFTPKSGPLRPEDILNLPLQICPHHSTTTGAPTRSLHTPNRAANGPILTHAIATVFPPGHQTNVPSPSVFRAPTPLEKKQIQLAAIEPVIWNCRGCTTKFRVELENESLLITSWHCFGSNLFHAVKYWKWMVRREAFNLGPGKRNSEFWYPSRTVPDFPLQQEKVCKPDLFGKPYWSSSR